MWEKNISDLELSITVQDYEGLHIQQLMCELRLLLHMSSGCVCVCVCVCVVDLPVCCRLCLVRACLVPPAKPHRSHR